MIKKIQSGEYLKRYDNMTAVEREEYEAGVGKWLKQYGGMLTGKCDILEARLQNIQQVSVTWNDQECQAFEDGALLLTALVGTSDTWLPDMLYVKSAKRCVRQMVTALGAVGKEPEGNPVEGSGENTGSPTHATAPFQGGKGNGTVAGGCQDGEEKVGLVPARPKHIDQYVHLLPKKTQEHAALVQGLYRELEDARQKMELLMNDKTASAADREAWAKKATRCDNTLRKILNELDAEWAKLVKEGRVTVDDLGNARVVNEVKSEEVKSEEPAELTSEQKARRRELRKWLVDTRRGNGDTREEYVKKWKKNFEEYLTMEGEAAFGDEKVMAAMEHYGINKKDFKK